MQITEGLEFYWPANLRSGVHTVARLFTSIDRRYGGAMEVPMAEVVDDYRTSKDWKVAELEETFVRGWTLPFEAHVPFKARDKLQTLAIRLGTAVDLRNFISFQVDGSNVNVGITGWTKRFVGAVDDSGRIVRKKSILDQVMRYLIENGLVDVHANT